MKQYFTIIMMLVTSICFGQTRKPVVEHPPNGHNSPYRISINDLIKQPVYYNTEPMQVIGYLSLERDGIAMYLNSSDGHNHRTKRAVWLDLSSNLLPKAKQSRYTYVSIDGIFSNNRHDFPRGYVGSLRKITSIEVLNKIIN